MKDIDLSDSFQLSSNQRVSILHDVVGPDGVD